MGMGWKRSLVGVFALGLLLTSCATDDPDGGSPPSASPSAVTSTVTVTPSMSPVPPPAPAPTETVVEETAVEPQPYIVGCQVGLGPIETYWSDGTVTGYSDYCQDQHDTSLRREREANTPACDGTVCRYPNGAQIPDPNAVPDDRCTNQFDYAGDPRSNAEINSIGEQTGQCPAPIS